MKKFTLYPTLITVTALLAVIGCKKTDQTDKTPEYKVQADDQMLISAEIDAVTVDANSIVESDTRFFQRNTTAGVCNATYTYDSTSAYKYFSVLYNGTNCAGKTKREGEVIITMSRAARWSDPGAVLTINYNNVKIIRVKDGKMITINGTVNLTNISGGRMSDIGTKNLVHDINSDNMSITFEDGTKRIWQIAVRRTFSFDNGLVISSIGTHSEGNKTGISAWGVTRRGRYFVSVIEEPMVIRQDCHFRLVSAKLVQHQNESLTITFGLDQNGEPVQCPSGDFYLKLVTEKGRSFISSY